MVKQVKVGNSVLNLDAVAYIEPGALPGTFRVYMLGPDSDAFIDLSKEELADLLAPAGPIHK